MSSGQTVDTSLFWSSIYWTYKEFDIFINKYFKFFYFFFRLFEPDLEFNKLVKIVCLVMSSDTLCVSLFSP